MNHYFENGLLTIFLEGRIDSNNAAQMEKELFEAAASAPPELSLKAAAKYYIRSIAPFKLRFTLAAVLCLVLLYISWGMPLLGAMKNIRVCAGMCMVLELAVMLLGLDVFTVGICAL